MQNPARGKATASMVLGIVSLICIWFGYSSLIGIVCGIIGLVLGIDAKKQLMPEEGRGMATAGVVCSAIGLGLCALSFLACVAFMGLFSSLLGSVY